MKKKVIIVLCVLVAILLFPVPLKKKDGGTVEYRALAYSVSDVHCIADLEDHENGKSFYEGIIVEIFGVEVFNNVK